jgi:hypothetical protein
VQRIVALPWRRDSRIAPRLGCRDSSRSDETMLIAQWRVVFSAPLLHRSPDLEMLVVDDEYERAVRRSQRRAAGGIAEGQPDHEGADHLAPCCREHGRNDAAQRIVALPWRRDSRIAPRLGCRDSSRSDETMLTALWRVVFSAPLLYATFPVVRHEPLFEVKKPQDRPRHDCLRDTQRCIPLLLRVPASLTGPFPERVPSEFPEPANPSPDWLARPAGHSEEAAGRVPARLLASRESRPISC